MRHNLNFLNGGICFIGLGSWCLLNTDSMDSLAADIADVNVSFVASPHVKKKQGPEQMSLCEFPTSGSYSENFYSHQASRKRSRELMQELDTQSVDIALHSSKKKARRPLSRVVSFANMIMESPGKAGKVLHRSISLKENKDRPASPAAKYRLPTKSPQRSSLRRRTTLRPQIPLNWVDVITPEAEKLFTKEETKRHEAIYTVLRTEMELIEDLKMVISIFLQPMLRLELISEEDHSRVFGNIQSILPLHQDLAARLQELKKDDETIDGFGKAMKDWVTKLVPYADYCANLVIAKHTLEQIKQNPGVQDFLQRCLDSEFSRKIDLWTFLDSPRSRIMKYPVLLKEVKKQTPLDHEDQPYLSDALFEIDSLLKEVDRRTGIAKCRDVIMRLDYLSDDQRCAAIDESQFIMCSGTLKNKNGSKLQVFLFDKALVLTRTTTRRNYLTYQVYRNPIPIEHLLLEDIADGDARIGGSFRGALSMASANTSKYLIKVSCSIPEISRHSHTLQACSDYNKKAWLDAFSLAKSQIVKQQHQITPSPSMTSLLSACSNTSV
ncbi:neuroepithelial cell-transforming gene 1 protein-like [Dysidea avara]|uniref:neuroepithelial cell-transforming gene 1 protein-like n=1 Tax=Dysidea avara TaxID=196820 RepID=UPI00331AFF6D